MEPVKEIARADLERCRSTFVDLGFVARCQGTEGHHERTTVPVDDRLHNGWLGDGVHVVWRSVDVDHEAEWWCDRCGDYPDRTFFSATREYCMEHNVPLTRREA